MKLTLFVIWLVLFSWSSVFVLAPAAAKFEDENAVVPQLVWSLLFWPLGIIAKPARLPEYLEWWDAEERGLKKWQAAVLLVALPLCLLGIMDGHGDLGSFWISVAAIAGTVGNLVLWVQIVKFAGVI
jgi:hypothetical protein